MDCPWTFDRTGKDGLFKIRADDQRYEYAKRPNDPGLSISAQKYLRFSSGETYPITVNLRRFPDRGVELK